MNNKIYEQYQLWLNRAATDGDIIAELQKMADDPEQITDAFYRNLSFGTAGLRGIMGVGTNRMNVYTVARASQGLAAYVIGHFTGKRRSVAIAYDSRHNSALFAKTAAEVFAANGITAYIYPELMPTPCLSFAVRELGCGAGVVVTASHNPAKYNGYKVYDPNGCQITKTAADEILAEIEAVDIFCGVKKNDFDTALKSGQIEYIPDGVYDAFVETVKAQSMLESRTPVDKNLSIVYSPLNGTGLKPVLRTLNECGFGNVTVVKEQEQPDGDFPTCPKPNPEIRQAMEAGIACAESCGAELLLATDPDCDRIGIAVRDKGEYRLLSGNQTGALLVDFICSRRIAMSRMPPEPVIVKTIVTSDLARQIAESYGVKTMNVLTGFKYIGEQIKGLENQGRESDYIFGFEESYGYLTGSYVRDKDAVSAALLICEMFAYNKANGISLTEKLDSLYKKFGFRVDAQHSFEFDGVGGLKKMQEIMQVFRSGLSNLGRYDIISGADYALGIDGLPKENALKLVLKDDCTIIVRPSGTEPKLKVYISVSADNKCNAEALESELESEVTAIIRKEP